MFSWVGGLNNLKYNFPTLSYKFYTILSEYQTNYCENGNVLSNLYGRVKKLKWSKQS